MKSHRYIRAFVSTKLLASSLLLVVGLILLGGLSQKTVTNEIDWPLGPTLPAFATSTPLPSQTNTDLAAAVPESRNQPRATPKPLCNGPEQMILLAIGADSRDGDNYSLGLADVIRVIRIDFVSPSISALAFPRDLWVEIPGLEGQGSPEDYFGFPVTAQGEVLVQTDGDYARINAAYFYGNLYGVGGGGPALLAQTLYQNFGLPVDHYLAVNMAVVSEAIDTVGGIDIYVPTDIESFSTGWQHMTGSQAGQYARIRYPDSDFHRIDRQTQVLLALRDKMLQPRTLRSLPSLVNAFLEDVVTDLSKAEIASLVCIVNKVDRDDIIARTVGPDMLTPVITTGKSYVLLPDETQVRDLVADFLNGTLSHS